MPRLPTRRLTMILLPIALITLLVVWLVYREVFDRHAAVRLQKVDYVARRGRRHGGRS